MKGHVILKHFLKFINKMTLRHLNIFTRNNFNKSYMFFKNTSVSRHILRSYIEFPKQVAPRTSLNVPYIVSRLIYI